MLVRVQVLLPLLNEPNNNGYLSHDDLCGQCPVSSPLLTFARFLYACSSTGLECSASNRKVGGSSPFRRTLYARIPSGYEPVERLTGYMQVQFLSCVHWWNAPVDENRHLKNDYEDFYPTPSGQGRVSITSENAKLVRSQQICTIRIKAIISDFQSEDIGSIPIWCSESKFFIFYYLY